MPYPIQTTVGFGNVSLPGTAGTFVQLPNIPCDTIGFAKTTGDIRLASSSSPGSNYLLLNTSASGQGANSNVAIPTGGNANNLWLANDTTSAQVVGFIWALRGAQPIVSAI